MNRSEINHRYYINHRDRILKTQKQWNIAHPEERKMALAKYDVIHKEKRREKDKKYHAKLRDDVLNHYGDRCICCGETEPKFLCIDHINGGGHQHRKVVGVGNVFYRWLKKQGYPLGFQILCHNCNMAKSLYGVCPHEGKRQSRVGADPVVKGVLISENVPASCRRRSQSSCEL